MLGTSHAMARTKNSVDNYSYEYRAGPQNNLVMTIKKRDLEMSCQFKMHWKKVLNMNLSAVKN